MLSFNFQKALYGRKNEGMSTIQLKFKMSNIKDAKSEVSVIRSSTAQAQYSGHPCSGNPSFKRLSDQFAAKFYCSYSNGNLLDACAF